MSQTPLLIKPSIGEIRRAVVALDMPPIEADKFWHHYESNGWKVGKNKMVSLNSALAGWKIRWLERNGNCHALSSNGLSGADKMIYQKELERVIERLRVIKSTYGEMQTWTKQDGAEYKRLISRRNELKKLLGIMI